MARSMVFSLSAEERLTSVEHFVIGFMAQERELQHVAKDVTSIKKELDEMKTSLQNVSFMCRVRAEERQLQDTIKYVESIKSEIKTVVKDITSVKARMEEISARLPGNELPQFNTGEEVRAEIAIAVQGAEAGDDAATGNGSNGEALQVSVIGRQRYQGGQPASVIKDMPDSTAAERFLALESRVVKIEAELSGVSSLRQDCGTSLSGVADRNNQTVQDVQTMLKEHVSDAAETLNEDGNSREYRVEESIYGLLAMPRTPLRFSICLLLTVLYTLTSGLVAIIYSSTVVAASSVRSELYAGSDEKDPICQRVFQGDSYTWVCSPPTLLKLMEFDKLDSNANGEWSVEEAKNVGLLSQFRAIIEVALEQREMLEGMFPPVGAEHNRFCSALLNVADRSSSIYRYLSEMEHLQMFFSEDRHSREEIDTILNRCHLNKSFSQLNDPAVWSTTFPMEWDPYACIMDSLCNPIPIVPGNNSESLFYSNTGFMACISKSLHEAFSLKMLRPCSIIDPELCANVEHQAHHLLSEVWPDLPLDRAVQKCSEWVKDVCPRLLGEEFRSIQCRMSEACGPRSYEVFEQTAARRSSFSKMGWIRQCKDANDGSAVMKTLVNEMFTQAPLMQWATYAEEVKFNFTRGTVQAMSNCKLGSSVFAFHINPLEITFKKQKAKIADIFGSLCPQSSCTRGLPWSHEQMPSSCPAECLYMADSANNVKDPFNVSFGCGEYTQTGNCEHFKTEVDAYSGSLKISRLGEIHPQAQEVCEMILRLDKTAQVRVTTWNLPKRTTGSQDGLCFGDFLETDGKKHCRAEKPPVVNLQPRPGPFEAMIWSTCKLCGEFDIAAGFDKSQMGFEMIITDALVPTQYPLVTVSFGNHMWYWDSMKGVQRPIFQIFLIAVMLIWIGYLSDELEKQLTYVRYINSQFNLTIRKFLLLFFLALPRFLVWAFVLYTGILLLVTANSYIDLVLNSVALAFILEFDEYLFAMAVPSDLKEQVQCSDAVRLTASLSLKSILGSGMAYDVHITFRMLCILVVFAVVVQALYSVDWLGSPHFNLVSEVYDCLCALHGPNCPTY